LPVVQLARARAKIALDSSILEHVPKTAGNAFENVTIR
jgi:hypothetical protein